MSAQNQKVNGYPDGGSKRRVDSFDMSKETWHLKKISNSAISNLVTGDSATGVSLPNVKKSIATPKGAKKQPKGFFHTFVKKPLYKTIYNGMEAAEELASNARNGIKSVGEEALKLKKPLYQTIHKSIDSAEKFTNKVHTDIKSASQAITKNETVQKGIESAGKLSEVVSPYLKHVNKSILSLLVFAGATTGASYAYKNATINTMEAQNAVAFTENKNRALTERKVEAYKKDLAHLLESGDMSYPAMHPEALENPVYGSMIRSTVKNPIGPLTITLNHEGMAQKATLDKRFTQDIVHAVKYITKYRDLFEYTAKRVDIPWELLAAIAERENHMMFVLDEDKTWQKFDEIEVFYKSYANGDDITETPTPESDEVKKETAEMIDAMPGISNIQREQLKAIFPLWVVEAQKTMYRQTNHRLYHKAMKLQYGSTDVASMLAYGEIHNSLFNRVHGIEPEYVYSGTSLSFKGKHMRNDNITGDGRFYYNAHVKDPQPGIFPVIRFLKNQPYLESAEDKQKFISYMSSLSKK